MWTVSQVDISAVLYYYYCEELFYTISIALSKASILFFYLRIFPQRRFRIATYTLLGLNVGFAISYCFSVAFQCSPISGAWLGWDGEFQTECLNVPVLGWTGAGIGIALDLAEIILPLPILAHLNMSVRKKLQVSSMFTVGLFVTIFSIIRLKYLVQFGNTRNFTQNYVEVGFWSIIETSAGVLCACMPAIGHLFGKILPNFLGFASSPHCMSGDEYNRSESPGKSSTIFSKLSGMPKSSNMFAASRNSEPGVRQEWSVMSHETQSDVELMAMEKMMNEPRPGRAASAGPTDQWSCESGVELPVQARRSKGLL
ncbi:hypothetical protein BJ170DRAFT_684791 [Xylariales sp. AK1849]|nr:hypothetical protein BJ170DRAFT_684791 [Xylariales sp. AK1849]